MNDTLPIAPDLFGCDIQVPVLHTDEFIERIGAIERRGLLPRWFAAPLYALWEINGRCPLRCAYCYNASPKVVDELTTKELLDVAGQLRAMQVFGVSVSGGEPTLRPDLFALLEAIREGGATTTLTTSGWTMNEHLASGLRPHLSAVAVSLDGARAETHDRVRRREGSFVRAVAAIHRLQDAGFAHVDVSFACTAYNIDEFPEVLNLCDELGVGSLRTHTLAMTGTASLNPEIAAVSPPQLDRVRAAVAAWNAGWIGGLRVAFFDTSGHIRSGLATGRALAVRITAEGYVGFTPHLPFVVGDVRRDRLDELWRRGLRTIWRHPEVRHAVGGIGRIEDVSLLGEEGRQYRFLELPGPTASRPASAGEPGGATT